MKLCPRCASEIGNKDKVCPRCNLPVDKMEFAEDLEQEAKSKKLNRAQKKEKKRLAKQQRKEAKRQKKLEKAVSPTDFTKFASTAKELKNLPKYNDKAMRFELDENGEFNIDTSDVEIIGEETMRMLDERREQSYSVKKARGDYHPERIKWWEIYKLADRSFARRKIKKEVNKAGRVKPENVNKWKLFFLCLFFGWVGAHNFYARNKRKGWLSVAFFTTACVGMMISSVPFIKAIELWLIGFTGFVVMFIWVSDIVNILFNQFSYRIQKDKFIEGMNVKTRAKLGEKYIDLDLLKKPWWCRLKAWWLKKRNRYKEWQHDRRQRLIEKEKRKAAEQAEQDKLDKEIAEFEENENKKFAEEKKAKKQAKKEEKIEAKELEEEKEPEEAKVEDVKEESKVDDKEEKQPAKKVTKTSSIAKKYSTRNNTKKKTTAKKK